MDLTQYIGPIVTAVVAIVGGYVAMKNANNEKFNSLSVQIASLSQQVTDLKGDVEKHNHVVEKTAINTRDLKTAFRCIDELREHDEKIEAKIEKLHDHE